MKISLHTKVTRVTYQLKPGKASVVPFRTGDWHPTSFVVVTDLRNNAIREYRLGETIAL